MATRNRMSEAELYNERYLDELAGFSQERRDNAIARAEMDWYDAHEADRADAFVNEHLKGWTDHRGEPLPGFEPIGATARTAAGRTAWKPGAPVTDEAIRAIMEERRRIELAADPEQTRRALAGTWR